MTHPNEEHPSSVLIVFCFIRRGDEILLVKRARPPYQGVWTIPGGHKKRGEEILAACLREMREETGLILHGCRLAGFMQVHTRGRTAGPEYLCIYYQTERFSGQTASSEEGPLAWHAIADIYHDPGTHPALRALLPYVERNECPFTAEAYVDDNGEGEYAVTGPGRSA